MTHDREHSSSSASAPAPTSYEVDPGRANSSALMRKPDHAFASGLVQRKARDANGVAEGADSAVAAASSSSGSPLPETLQRKFESSLGADLSSVRVHTGNSSATANDAVGAKAYTMGNDIHFGAGNYDPSSADGEHLLAHEVAHTVQQGGGAQRMQFKLAVSSPGDAMEHEADRAADAMVSGAHAAVTSAGGLARKPTVPSPLGGAYTMDPLGLPKKGTPVGDVDDPKNFPASMSSDSKEFSDMAAAVAATEKAITTVKNVVGSFAASSRSSILGACALLNQMAAIEGKAYTRFANALTEGKMKVKEEHDEKVQFAVQLAVGFILDPIEHAVEHLVGSKAVTKVIMSVVETVVASPVEQAVSNATKPKVTEKMEATADQLTPVIEKLKFSIELTTALASVSELQDLRTIESSPLSSLTMRIQAAADGKEKTVGDQKVSMPALRKEVKDLAKVNEACAVTTQAASLARPNIDRVCSGLQTKRDLTDERSAERRYWLEWLSGLDAEDLKEVALDKKLSAHIYGTGVTALENPAQQIARKSVGKMAKVVTTLQPEGKVTVPGVEVGGMPAYLTARVHAPGFPTVKKEAGTYGTVLAAEGEVLLIEAGQPDGFVGQCDEPIKQSKVDAWGSNVE